MWIVSERGKGEMRVLKRLVNLLTQIGENR